MTTKDHMGLNLEHRRRELYPSAGVHAKPEVCRWQVHDRERSRSQPGSTAWNPVILTSGSPATRIATSAQAMLSTQPGSQEEDNRTTSCGTCCWRNSSSGTYGWRPSYWGTSHWTQEAKLVTPAEEKEEDLDKLTKKALVDKCNSLGPTQGEDNRTSVTWGTLVEGLMSEKILHTAKVKHLKVKIGIKKTLLPKTS